MVKNQPERATANLRMLEFVARKLGPLRAEIVSDFIVCCTNQHAFILNNAMI